MLYLFVFFLKHDKGDAFLTFPSTRLCCIHEGFDIFFSGSLNGVFGLVAMPVSLYLFIYLFILAY